MSRHRFSILINSLFALTLASCAAIKEQPSTSSIEPVGWKAEYKQRERVNAWEIRGRLGVQSEHNGGSMDIIWQQSEQDYSIRLIAPLGAGNYHIQGNDEYAEVRYPDGKKEVIVDIDKVFEQALQVPLPITAIRDWLRGLPAKGLPIQRISWNAEGLIDRLKQSGWNVEMKKYTGATILWPHAIYLSRDDNPELDLRLALRQWLVDIE